ncbi:MAG TPA: hypothetical protein OIL97_04160 [Oscillospiraceae bacterium]|nr:hypothetical protein [Oscillospiraceae bacterium]
MMKFNPSNFYDSRFIDRCITFPNYAITYYIEDMSSAQDVGREIVDYLDAVSYKDEIKVIQHNEQIKIEFFNGSVINLITKEHMISGICSNVIFMDSRIREDYIKKYIKPKIDQYVISEGNAILNPKPIYLDFYEEEK